MILRYNGKLIVFEGIDGSGKSTQAKMLTERLKTDGKNVTFGFEPTNVGYGKKLRDSFFAGRYPLEEEYELFTLDRKDNIKNNIVPVVENGGVFVLDRYYYSTAAYQGARGLSVEKIFTEQEEFAYTPDIVFLVDISVDTALARIESARGEANLFEKREYLEKVKNIFDGIERDYVVRVDGEKKADEIARFVYSKVSEILY